MCSTCAYAADMPRMIQIRNVPDDLHGQLKSRADLEGMTLSDFLLREVRRLAERPTPAEIRSRLLGRRPVEPSAPTDQAVRAERDGR